jgi:hypothetical protein
LVSTTSPTALTPDGTLTLNYVGLISPIVAALQSLMHQLTSLEATVAGFTDNFVSAHITVTTLDASEGHFSNQLCVGSVCVTPAQFQSMLAAANQSGSSPTSPPGDDTTDTPPVIQVIGDNPAVLHVGDTYADLGATITGPQADLNLGIKTFLNGALMSNIIIDTSSQATDTIDYVATDSTGLTSTSTRTVLIEPAAMPPAASPSAADTASTTTTP